MKKILCLLLFALMALTIGALERNHVPKDWKGNRHKANEMLPDAQAHRGMATLKARVLGYRPEMGLDLIVSGFSPLDEIGDFWEMYPIAPDGTVTARVPVWLTRSARVEINGDITTQTYVLIAPGQETEMLIDLDAEGCRFIDFRGYMARTNKEIAEDDWARKQNEKAEAKAMYTEFSKLETPEQRVQFFTDWLSAEKRRIGKLHVTEASKALMRMRAEFYYVNTCLSFAHSYIALLDCAGIEPRPDYDKLEEKLKEYTPLMPHDTAVSLMQQPATYETATRRYAPASPYFWAFGYFGGEWSDAYTSQLLYLRFVLDHTTNEHASHFRKYITSPDLLAILQDFDAARQRLCDELARQPNVFLHDLDSVSANDVLPTILNRYRGRPVLIDVWETWCGSCRFGHQRMASLKKELKDHSIAFVYLASESSPLQAWHAILPSIEGDHYYLTREQNEAVCKQLNSRNVPTYVLYDANGKETWHHLGQPDMETLRQQLANVIEMKGKGCDPEK